MERLQKLTTPRAQLYGSFIAVVVVLFSGTATIWLLGDKLERAREGAEEARSRSWILSVAGAAVDTFSAADLVEISDRSRFESAVPVTLYTVRHEGRPVATAVKWLAPRGYNGDIELAMAVDRHGMVTRMSVLSQRETPGFGDVIGNPDSSWIDSFRGRSLENPEAGRWRLRSDGGDIDGISGATITAGAVVAGVLRALSYLEQSGTTSEN